MTRKKLAVLALASALVVAMLPTTATAEDDVPLYVSLGTSLAAGTTVASDGTSVPFSDTSYTDQLHSLLAGRGMHFDHVKLGCPGETTDQLLGGVNVFGQPSNCAGLYASGYQMGDALAAIATGNVGLITIDIGANDILQAQFLCDSDPDCILAEIPGILTNVGTIVGTLRASGYTGPIIGMNYYNPQIAAAIGFYSGQPGPLVPDPEFAVLTDVLSVGFNAALADVYAATGAHTANVYGKFNSGDFGDDRPANGVWDNVDYVCRLTFMCPYDLGFAADIHPKPLGYRVIAKAFVAVIQKLGKA